MNDRRGKAGYTPPTAAAYVAIAAFFACFNCLVLPLTVLPEAGAWIGVAAVGVIGAQVSLVAAWGVFSAHRYATRVCACAAAGLALYGCLAAGTLINQDPPFGPPPRAMLFLLTVCPCLFLAVQTPLWVARIWLGWEVARSGQAVLGSYGTPTQIKDMVLGSVAVAVTLSVVRISSRMLPGTESPEDVLIGVAFMAAAAGVASLLANMPLLVVLLRIRRIAWSVVGVAAWFVLAVCGQAAALILMNVPVSRADIAAGTCLATAGYSLPVCFALGMVRIDGYRLRWGVRRTHCGGESHVHG